MSALSRSRLRNKTHPDYESFAKLYEISFPIFEQRTTAQQELALKDSRYELILFKQDDLFVGFVAAWIFEECVYSLRRKTHDQSWDIRRQSRETL